MRGSTVKSDLRDIAEQSFGSADHYCGKALLFRGEGFSFVPFWGSTRLSLVELKD